MLLDEVKQAMDRAVLLTRQRYGDRADAWFMKHGPRGLVEMLLMGPRNHEPSELELKVLANMKECRKELEEYTAGLLGMM